ncbi:50S ribosomal protein L9 [Candidatus Uhrbacteria bacterium]|nr:50S ribosomal protein L9 [Candidatus Uhrbacteria bacterium]
MQVILLSDVKTLGKEGMVVEVSDGHARNFLFPQNLAIAATDEALRKLKERDEALKKEAHKDLSVYGDLAQQLDGYELILTQKVNEQGTFYGAVTDQQIASALKQEGFKQIEKSMIQLVEPIKEPGEISIKILLPHGFEAEVKIIVEGK